VQLPQLVSAETFEGIEANMSASNEPLADNSAKPVPDLLPENLEGQLMDVTVPPTDKSSLAERPSAEDQAALEPSSHADRVGGEADASGGLGADAGIPETTVSGGQALPGLRAFAGASLQISEDVGITPETYKSRTALRLRGKDQVSLTEGLSWNMAVLAMDRL
jgi:hypothetical protein